MSGKGMGIITAALGVLGGIGISALVMWYNAASAPADLPGDDDVTLDSAVHSFVESPPNTPEAIQIEASDQAIPSPGRLMVEIQGAVLAPGVYSFPREARVHDALEKSGGALEVAEIRDINIAAALVDGSVLTVPYQQQQGGPPQPGAADLNPPAYTRSGWTDSTEASIAPAKGGTSAPGNAKVNINTATQSELETLPGVGEKTAEKIMRHREAQPFTQVDDLGFVQGIGERRLETLRPHVTVE